MPLFALQPQTHLKQILLRSSTLAVAAPVDPLQFREKLCCALGITRHTAGLHVSDALPGFRSIGKVVDVFGLSLHEHSLPPVRSQTCVQREHGTLARIGSKNLD